MTDGLKKLKRDELESLCASLRCELIESVSKTGGHLASNLGMVELTVALHRVFDTSSDRLIFDVGHQCYTHKLLTGRREQFDSLRGYGGLSGFPDPNESIHDAFRTGHASTSVSAALGMARARTLSGGEYNVIAVIGDGALTGGLAYEALCDAGESRERIIVILNDNEMSIDRTSGGVARLLSKLRLRPAYTRFKQRVWLSARKNILLRPVVVFGSRIKQLAKSLLIRNNMFEDMGFTYLGPVDGHDTLLLSGLLELAKGYDGSVLIHAITKKGKGYAPAEKSPADYHGMTVCSGASDADVPVGTASARLSFSQVFGEELVAVAREDGRICAITAAMAGGTGLGAFAREFPCRFFDVGIAEQHAVTMAAGLSALGQRPVFAVYSTFAQRAYDQLIHDVALGGYPVVLALDRAGIVGEDGATHHGIFDVGFLAQIPGMTVYAPSSYSELRAHLRLALSRGTPAAVRFPRGGEGEYTECSDGDAALMCGGEGTLPVNGTGKPAVTVVCYGIQINDATNAAHRLEDITVEVIKLNVISPLPVAAVLESVRRTGNLVVVEDAAAAGSVGQRIAAELALAGVLANVRLLNHGNTFPAHGDSALLRAEAGIDADGIMRAIIQMLQTDGTENNESGGTGDEKTS